MLALFIMSACEQKEADKPQETKAVAEKTTEPTKTEEEVVVIKEAPELAEKVANGELPPLEDRLPEVPIGSCTFGFNRYIRWCMAQPYNWW